MSRTLLLPALLLAAVPAFAETLTVHLQYSDSVRAALVRGDIDGVLVATANRSVMTKSDTAILENVPAGPAKLRTLIHTPSQYFAVDPDRGTDIAVNAGGSEVTLPVHAIFVTGTLTQRGKPLRAGLNIWPSERTPKSWGFASASDDNGRFAFPVTSAGRYDVQVTSWDRRQSTNIPDVEFGGAVAHIELPAGAIAGRVVNADGKGVAGEYVKAKFDGIATRGINGGATTDADGNFAIEGLVAGKWTLTAPGRPAVEVVVPDGERKDGVLLRAGD